MLKNMQTKKIEWLAELPKATENLFLKDPMTFKTNFSVIFTQNNFINNLLFALL